MSAVLIISSSIGVVVSMGFLILCVYKMGYYHGRMDVHSERAQEFRGADAEAARRLG